MGKAKINFGTILLQIALGLMFIVSGIWILMGNNSDEIAKAINSIFSGDIEKIIKYAFAIIELIVGVFLLIRLFVPINTKLDSVLMVIIMVCWIIAIVMIDILGKDGIINSLNRNFLSFLYRLSIHLLILGTIIKLR